MEIHPLILSSIFHYEFVFIHPFQDGNSRVRRIILFKECLKNGNELTNEDLIEMVSNLEVQEYNISAEFDDEGVITNIVITEIEDIES